MARIIMFMLILILILLIINHLSEASIDAIGDMM